MLAPSLYNEAAEAIEYVAKQQPFTASVYDTLPLALGFLGNIDGVMEAANRSRAMSPPDSFRGLIALAWALPRGGRFEETEALRAEIQSTIATAVPGSARRYTEDLPNDLTRFELARLQGNHDRALQVVEERLSDVYFDDIHDEDTTLSLLVLGDARVAIFLEKALHSQLTTRDVWRYVSLMYIPPEFREHPIVRELEDAMGHTKEWRLELYKRAATLPPESHISCDPETYALWST